MKAKFVFEKFTEDSDPIKDMGIGSFNHYFNTEISPKDHITFYAINDNEVHYTWYKSWGEIYITTNGDKYLGTIPDLKVAKKFILNHYLNLKNGIS